MAQAGARRKAGQALSEGPAHYTATEQQTWAQRLLPPRRPEDAASPPLPPLPFAEAAEGTQEDIPLLKGV
eukprot:9411576-Prorocentrum_lima.AAC.1